MPTPMDSSCAASSETVPELQDAVLEQAQAPHKTADINRYLKDRYYTMKRWALDQLGNQCAWCGSSSKLQFDHKNLNDKDFDITRALRSKPKPKIEQELKKCQLLCMKCHNRKTSVEKAARGIRGSRMGSAKLNEEDVKTIKQAISSGRNNSEIAREFNVSNVAICLIKKGKTWGHVR